MNFTYSVIGPKASWTPLSTSSRDIEAMINANPTPTLIVNPKGNIIHLNPAALENPLFNNQEERKIYDIFPTLTEKEFFSSATRITLPDSLSTELSFCRLTDNDMVIYLKPPTIEQKKSKLEKLLTSQPSKRTSFPLPKRAPSPILDIDSQKTIALAHQFVKKNQANLDSSYLPAYSRLHESTEEAPSRSINKPLSRSVSPFDSQQTKNDLITITQLYFDTIHTIRNGLVLPFSLVEELGELMGQIKQLTPTNPISSESVFIKTQTVVTHLKTSLQSIQKIMDEQVEVENETIETHDIQPLAKKEAYKKDLKILIAEDNHINFMVLKRTLEKLGFTSSLIQHAENGQQAVKMTKNTNFDLIFMDIHMPEMDGNEAAKIIREKSQIPIIACTGSADDEIEKTSFTRIVKKPTAIETLKKEIESIFTFTQETIPA